MKNNVVREKSFAFALRIIRLNKYLRGKRKEFVLSDQVLRSGTSIGANLEEADAAQSGKDFFAKVCIAYKEARETHYWLRLLHASEYLADTAAASILLDCEEIIRLLSSIKCTMQKKLEKE